MFTKFLHRPALAIVISLLILFMGGLAIMTLPISQFPDVAPPSVQVSVSFPGASAKVLVESTMVILERAINGVPVTTRANAAQILRDDGEAQPVALTVLRNGDSIVLNAPAP